MIDEMAEKPGAIAKMVAWQKEHISDRQMTLILAFVIGTAAIGGVAGGLVVYSIAFSFNPIWWLAFVILLAGMVGTARMILRQHTLAQVVAGFLVGVVCALFII